MFTCKARAPLLVKGKVHSSKQRPQLLVVQGFTYSKPMHIWLIVHHQIKSQSQSQVLLDLNHARLPLTAPYNQSLCHFEINLLLGKIEKREKVLCHCSSQFSVFPFSRPSII